MDEFPEVSLLDGQGGIDRELFPSFSGLSHRATWYRNSTTIAGFTEEAVPAILTGRYPTATRTPPTASAHPRNLFTMLDGHYSLNVHETVTHLCVAAECGSDSASTLGMVSAATRLWWNSLDPQETSDAVARQLVGLSQAKRSVATARSFVQSLRPSAAPRAWTSCTSRYLTSLGTDSAHCRSTGVPKASPRPVFRRPTVSISFKCRPQMRYSARSSPSSVRSARSRRDGHRDCRPRDLVPCRRAAEESQCTKPGRCDVDPPTGEISGSDHRTCG